MILQIAFLAVMATSMQTPATEPMTDPNIEKVPVAVPPANDLQAGRDEQFKADYDDSMQRYIIRLPNKFDANAVHDVMIAFHGHGSDRNQFAYDPRPECKGSRDVAAAHNIIFVSPDYRAPTSWMNAAAEADTVQLIRILKKNYKIGNVFIVGGSMGGTAVLTFAALHPELVDGICSLNGAANLLIYDVNYAGIQDAMKNSFGGRKDETPKEYKKRNPNEYKKRSAEFHPEKFTVPLAITVGGKDEIVPPDSVLRFAKSVSKRNSDVLIINRPNESHQTSYEDTVSAIEFILNRSCK